jgi:DNA-directed RNA polymerase specialized sigma24 family protein
MSPDPFVAAAEEVAAAGRAACQAMESAIGALEAGARARTSGVPLVDVVDELIAAGGRDVRLATADAFHEFERAVAEMRARVVCALVEEDGLSLTEVALRLRISRQAVARLHRNAKGADGPAEEVT